MLPLSVLTYRIWGKLFEQVSAHSAEFTAPTLASFLWATSTANVSHYKTVAELAGPAAALLKSMTPAQLSVVVEALGAAGVADAQMYSAVADAVSHACISLVFTMQAGQIRVMTSCEP